MKAFVESLKSRNETLFYFGLLCLVLALLCWVLSRVSPMQVQGVNAWYKPLKFCLSTTIFSWSMAWYLHYLPQGPAIKGFVWVTVIALGFEIAYIGLQAARGQLSHFNQSSPFYAAMFSLMAVAATVVTLYTAYIALLFFTKPLPALPQHYLWAIRLGLLIFVVFSFQGFTMGARLAHGVGGADGGPGLLFLNWSITHGDLRVAHFIGMHALQVLPLLAWYALKNTGLTLTVATLYLALAAFTWWLALAGKPILRL